MPAVKPAKESQHAVTSRAEVHDEASQEWFDEAVVVDADWAVIYTTRGDGSRRGIRVPLRAVLAPEDDVDAAPDAAAAAG